MPWLLVVAGAGEIGCSGKVFLKVILGWIPERGKEENLSDIERRTL